MEQRITKLETDVAGIQSGLARTEARIGKLETNLWADVGELRACVQGLRLEVKEDIRRLADKTEKLWAHKERDFRILFGALIATSLGLAGVMAKGFGWFH